VSGDTSNIDLTTLSAGVENKYDFVNENSIKTLNIKTSGEYKISGT
jgi:hypothetical protein